MKKLITLLVTIAMIGVMLTGCGGSGKEVTADPAKLAEDLSKTASGDTLSSISEDILASTYLVDTSKIDSCAAYVGTGATASSFLKKCSLFITVPHLAPAGAGRVHGLLPPVRSEYGRAEGAS